MIIPRAMSNVGERGGRREDRQRGVVMQAPAKITLYLEILGRRPNGYHDLRSVVVPVSLFDEVRLERKDQQFLYEADGLLTIMDNETFEQIELPADLLGDRRPFLQDGMMVTVEYFGDEALNVSIPPKVICKVVETEPVLNGQTAAKSYKPAVLDNGLRIMVPPFVGPDEDIVVHTETFEYSERA